MKTVIENLLDEYDMSNSAFAKDLREALAEQPAQQEPAAYGMFDTMLGKGNRMMMVRLDKGQDGCTVPLYTSPPAQRKPLTVHEIAEFVGTHEYGPEQLKWFRLGEAAHGIKENT